MTSQQFHVCIMRSLRINDDEVDGFCGSFRHGLHNYEKHLYKMRFKEDISLFPVLNTSFMVVSYHSDMKGGQKTKYQQQSHNFK